MPRRTFKHHPNGFLTLFLWLLGFQLMARYDYQKTSTSGLIRRAGRAAEDPAKMTLDATLGRLAKHVVAIVRENPDLEDKAIAKGARLRLRAEMADLARKRTAARKAATGTESTADAG